MSIELCVGRKIIRNWGHFQVFSGFYFFFLWTLSYFLGVYIHTCSFKSSFECVQSRMHIWTHLSQEYTCHNCGGKLRLLESLALLNYPLPRSSLPSTPLGVGYCSLLQTEWAPWTSAEKLPVFTACYLPGKTSAPTELVRLQMESAPDHNATESHRSFDISSFFKHKLFSAYFYVFGQFTEC